jgi:hypothetical protein
VNVVVGHVIGRKTCERLIGRDHFGNPGPDRDLVEPEQHVRPNCPGVIRLAHPSPRIPRFPRTAWVSQRFVWTHATGLRVLRSRTCAPPLNALMRGCEQVLAHYAVIQIMPSDEGAARRDLDMRISRIRHNQWRSSNMEHTRDQFKSSYLR